MKNGFRRISIIGVSLLFILSGVLILAGDSNGTITPLNITSLVSNNQRIHENSTAVPVFGIGARSSTGSDTLNSMVIRVTSRSSSFSISDIDTIGTTMTTSGVAIYRDDGVVNDDLDPSDTPLSISSVTLVTGSSTWDYTFTISSETVPTSISGSYQWLIVTRTSSTCVASDSFDIGIAANGISYSDATTSPSSTRRTNVLTVYMTGSRFIGTSSPVPVGEEGVNIDELEVQGLSIFSGSTGTETIDSIEIELTSISGFDPWVDLKSIDDTTNSGLTLYLDDGPGTPDVWDGGNDTMIVPQTISIINNTGSWSVFFDLPDTGSSAYNVPGSTSGNIDMFVRIATSSSISDGDRFYTQIPAWGLTYYGQDGQSRSVLTSANRSRTIEADTNAPDMSNASLRIYTNPVSGYMYEADTDLSGRDEIFYNSVNGQGLGLEVFVNIAQYVERNLIRFRGEAAFNYDDWNDDTEFSSSTQISYRITEVEPNNPMTFYLMDSVGHSSSFDVHFTEDNAPPRVSNMTMTDSSIFIETQLENKQIYFRPNMVNPHEFHIAGNGFEPANESGLRVIDYSFESTFASSPASDYDPSYFNGSYNISSTSQSSGLVPLVLEMYDNVQNKWSMEINYTRITAAPALRVIQPSFSGINVSGIYRVIAQVQAVPSILKLEFGVDGETDLVRMTYGSTFGGWDTYYLDWDTVDYTEGEHVIKVKATDMTNGVTYNNSFRVNVNNYPLWGFFQDPVYGEAHRGLLNVNIRTSSYLRNVKLYLGDNLVDTFTGYPTNGRVHLLLDTTQFSDGNYNLKAELTGFAGRYLELFTSIELDNTVPVIERIWVDFPGHQSALKPGDPVQLKAQMYDNQSGLVDTYVVSNAIGGSVNQLLFDNGVTDDGDPFDNVYATFEFTTDGAWAFHTVRFVVTDRAGNTIERKMVVAIDDKAPLVEELWIDYPGSQEGMKSGDEVQVKAEFSDSTAPIYVTLILDNSGSMGQSGAIDYLIKAAKSYINFTRDIDYVAIYRFYWLNEDPFGWTYPGGTKRILNFTRMDDAGSAQALSVIDNVRTEFYQGGGTGTPIWDTIGNATQYTIDNAKSNPFVIAFTDGADNWNNEQVWNETRFEEGSAHFAPWHSWNTNRFVDYHWGKYPDDDLEIPGYFWVRSHINQSRMGLLNIPIPVYTIGLGLEHHDPPDEPVRTSAPSEYEHDNTSAYWFGESGTPEYNLWRVAETSAGGQYYYAPSATFLESVYRKISQSIYAGSNPAKIRRATALLPLDITLDVEFYNDGLHNDGLLGDDIWATQFYEVPDLPTEDREVIVDVWDWANNTDTWYVNMISDNTVPFVRSVDIVYPEGRSSVGDGEEFHIQVNLTDKGAGIWKIIGAGDEIGYFPPVIFNNTGKGNDLNETDNIFTSINISGQTGNEPSTYKFIDLEIIDYAGNSINARVQVLMVNDFAAPILTMITPGDGGFLGGDDPISCIARDDGEIQRVVYEIRDDNGTIVQDGFIKPGEMEELYSSRVDVTRIPEGYYVLEVMAIDSAGRIGSSGALDIGIDNTNPSFTLNYPGNGTYVGGIVSFSYKFDETFHDFVGYSVDGGPYLDAGDGMDTTKYSEGYHLVGVRGFNLRGKSQGLLLDLYFDNSIPNVDLSLPTDGIMVNGTQKVLARVMDGGGIQYVETRIYEWGNRTSPTPPGSGEMPVVSLRMDGPQEAVVISGFYEGSLATYGLPDGRYLLDVAAVDRSGTIGHALQYLPIDNNAPILKVLYPVDNGAVTGSFTPDAEAIDPFLSSAYFQFNGQKYSLDSTIDMNGIPDGKYSMKFVAIDNQLRTSTLDLTIFVDKTPPGVKLLSPGDGYAAEDELLVLARVDEVAGVRYAFLNMDGDDLVLGTPVGNGGLYSFLLNMTPFDRRPHEIKVVVENNAGLITETETRIIYKGYPDTDGDGVMDDYDDRPDDPTYSGDFDGDGFGTFTDDDDDNDGVLDDFEPSYDSLTPSGKSKGMPFKHDPTEWADTDEDGIGDNSDPDADGDSIVNELDSFPYDPLEWSDIDGDGIGDNSDSDRDGDGVKNSKDDLPFDPLEWTDTDGDGVGNNKDDDDDGDGLPDSRDDFPTNRFRKYRYMPIVLPILLGLIAVIAIFSAMVFRERIGEGMERSWTQGRMKKTRDTIKSAFREKEENWEDEKGRKMDRRPRQKPRQPRKN